MHRSSKPSITVDVGSEPVNKSGNFFAFACNVHVGVPLSAIVQYSISPDTNSNKKVGSATGNW